MLIVLTLYLKSGELQVDPIQGEVCQNHLKMCIASEWFYKMLYKNGVCYLK